MSRHMYGAFVLRPLAPDDWDAVRKIYLEGIATGEATFETAAPKWSEWDAKHLPFARLVAVSAEGLLIGWAALSAASTRRAYAGVAEVSVYVSTAARAQGVGRALLEALIEESERNSIWTLQASIFPENVGSVKLHLHCGFRTVGLRERIAQLNEIWHDTVVLERRSKVAGTS